MTHLSISSIRSFRKTGFFRQKNSTKKSTSSLLKESCFFEAVPHLRNHWPLLTVSRTKGFCLSTGFLPSNHHLLAKMTAGHPLP